MTVQDLLQAPGGLWGQVLAILNQPKQPMYDPSPSRPTPTPVPQSAVDRLTYYLPTGNLTSTGTTPKGGYTAAISPDLEKSIPFGSLIKLPNGQTVRVEDRTNKRLKSTLDIYYPNKEVATYPQGMANKVPYQIVGRDVTGLKYNY